MRNKGVTLTGLQQGIIFFVVILLIVVAINVLIGRSLKNSDERKVLTLSAQVKQPVQMNRKISEAPLKVTAMEGEIIRRSQVIPGDDYEENVFYQGGKVIARQKIVHGEIVDQSGNIPDGKIRVEGVNQRSMGEEFYENGQRTGISRVYYKDGALWQETTYFKGKVLSKKEYFKNGVLHIIQDFHDALDIPGEMEVGSGKVFYPNGKLRYEWNLTRSVGKGFKKAYNENGEVVMETYFNEKGEGITE